MRPHLSSPVAASPLAEPQAEQHPLERTLHDLRLIDEYAWLYGIPKFHRGPRRAY
jgi:hypothetical protein